MNINFATVDKVKMRVKMSEVTESEYSDLAHDTWKYEILSSEELRRCECNVIGLILRDRITWRSPV